MTFERWLKTLDGDEAYRVAQSDPRRAMELAWKFAQVNATTVRANEPVVIRLAADDARTSFVETYGVEPEDAQIGAACEYALRHPEARISTAFSAGVTCGSNARLIALLGHEVGGARAEEEARADELATF